jgi:hypothetical protein
LTPVPARSDCLDKMVGGKLPVGETCTLVVRSKQAVRKHARAQTRTNAEGTAAAAV